MPNDHPRHVAEFVGEVAGGPRDYTANRGGHATMLAQHLGRNISEAQRCRLVNLPLDSADEVGLPADPEFRSALVAYLEWGSPPRSDEFEIATGDCGGSLTTHAEVGMGNAGRTLPTGEEIRRTSSLWA